MRPRTSEEVFTNNRGTRSLLESIKVGEEIETDYLYI
jgi:hypothetical protein